MLRGLPARDLFPGGRQKFKRESSETNWFRTVKSVAGAPHASPARLAGNSSQDIGTHLWGPHRARTIRRTPFRRTPFRRTPFRRTYSLPYVHFAVRTFCRTYILPYVHFAVRTFRRTDYSPYGQFAVRTFRRRTIRRQAFSPYGHSAVNSLFRLIFPVYPVVYLQPV